MWWRSRWILAVMLAGLCAATAGVGEEAAGQEDGPGNLDTPFTAEEIRDEWIEGLTIEMRRTVPDGQVIERWTVVGSDEEGMDLEVAILGDDGQPVGEVTVRHATWEGLRDHASFPADLARRERATRSTPLGELEGWLYTVEDPDGGPVTRFFFADELPGAPVWMQVQRQGEAEMVLEQVERFRPPQ